MQQPPANAAGSHASRSAELLLLLPCGPSPAAGPGTAQQPPSPPSQQSPTCRSSSKRSSSNATHIHITQHTSQRSVVQVRTPAGSHRTCTIPQRLRCVAIVLSTPCAVHSVVLLTGPSAPALRHPLSRGLLLRAAAHHPLQAAAGEAAGQGH
jgi:hypothetical protein